MDLTRIKEGGRKISSAEILEILYKQKKCDILLIKVFDRLHNTQTIGVKSSEKAKKMIKETLSKFISLSIYLGIPEIGQMLSELCLHNLLSKQQLPYKQHKISHNL